MSNEVNTDEGSRFIRHLNRWKSIYEIFGFAIAIGLSFWANRISSNALKLMEGSLQKQDVEFRLRNRPYVILNGTPKLSGDIKYSFETKQGEKRLREYGENFQSSMEVTIHNISDVPAKQVKGNSVVYLNNEQVYKIAITPISLVKGDSINILIGLKAEWCKVFIEGSKELSVDFNLTYTGMLGESPEHFQTNIRFVFLVDAEKNSYRCLYTEYDIK